MLCGQSNYWKCLMPEDPKDDATNKTMLRWILGLVAGGLGAIGVWIGSQMAANSDFTRKLVEQTQSERVENIKAVSQLSTNIAANTEALRSVQKQGESMVKYLENIRDDQRKGVWRATDVPKRDDQ